MRKIKLLVGVLAVVLTMASCSKVPAGNVGIKFYLLGSEKGVDYETLGPGRYWIGVNEELYLFPTQNQTKTWTTDSRSESPRDEDFEFQSKNGLKLTASVSIEYLIQPKDVPQVFETYKTGVDEISNRVLRNALRDGFNQVSSLYSAEEIYGLKKNEFMAKVIDIAKAEASERGISVLDIYLIGSIGVPSSITTALENKMKSTQEAQQRERELQTSIAQFKKDSVSAASSKFVKITKAQGEAEANRLLDRSLTKEIIQLRWIEKWNGTLPKVSGEGSSTLVDLRTK